jgi:ribonuclease HI
VFCDGS